MGGGVSKPIVYAQPVTEARPGETAVYRSAKHLDALLVYPKSGAKTVQEIFLRNFTEMADREYLGYRPVESWKTDPKTTRLVPTLKAEYAWHTWATVHQRVLNIGSGIEHLGLAPTKSQYKDYHLRFVGIHSKNCVEWVLTDIANICFGYVTMPLYDTLGEEATEYMLAETELETLFVAAEHAKKHAQGIKTGKYKFLKTLVVLDEDALTPGDLQELEGAKWYRLSQVEDAGRQHVHPMPKVTPEDISCFSYTSGTTGKPKGAMISHKNQIALVAGAEDWLYFLKPNTVILSYLPLAHVFEKVVWTQISYLGAKYGLYGGDVLKLKEDLAVLKPTLFAGVPRLFNKFHDGIKTKLAEVGGCKASLANKAIRTKVANIEASGQYTHMLYDAVLFNKLKAVLGGRVEILFSGSAPMSQPVKKFLMAAFSSPFLEGYGQTEGIGGQFCSDLYDKEIDSVGGPVPMNEFKLVDVPEMGYRATDKDAEGRPAPRGEIYVRGANVIPGYYKDEARTKEAINADGWLITGDVGMIIPGSHALRIIDRKKNIFKLSQGEYVAPERLEQVYKTSPGIVDIYVHGDSLKSSLVAVVNLDEKMALSQAKANGIQVEQFADLVNNEAYKTVLLAALAKTGSENGLKGFEKISRVCIDPVLFADNGLLTITFKLKRHEAGQFYQRTFAKLYEGID